MFLVLENDTWKKVLEQKKFWNPDLGKSVGGGGHRTRSLIPSPLLGIFYIYTAAVDELSTPKRWKKTIFYFLITGLFSGPAHAPGRLNRPNMIITYNFRGFSDEKNVSLIFEVGPEGNPEGLQKFTIFLLERGLRAEKDVLRALRARKRVLLEV